MPSCLATAHWLPSARSSASRIMLRSRISIASARKIFPPTKCSTRASNFSFILFPFPGGPLVVPVAQGLLPRGLRLRVGLAKALFELVGRQRYNDAGGVGGVRSGAG